MAGRVVSPELVGRAADLVALHAAVEACPHDDRCVVLVTGDAGIGKTRLLRELAAELRAGTAAATRVAWGTCLRSPDLDLPFSPIPGLLLGLAVSDPGGAVAEAVDRARSEVLRTGFSGTDGPVADRGSGRLRTFEAVLDAVRAARDALPPSARLVLVVDDVHWADTGTLDLLAFLARRLGRSGVLLVLAFRREALLSSPGLRALVLDLERDWVIERVDLRPLAPDAVRMQIRAIDRAGAHDPALIVARAEGNPFVVEELLRLPRATGAVPESLRELLRARLDGLRPDACRLVDAAAVLARPAPPALLATIAAMDRRELGHALSAACEAGILVEAEDGIGFRHSLLGEAAGDALPEETAARLHFATATALEASAGPRMPAGLLLEVAHHWDLGGAAERAQPSFRRAAEAAEAAFAWSSAAKAYTRAADLALAADGPSAEAVLLTRRSGDMWIDASEPVLARAQMRRAARLAGRAGLEDERARAWAEVAYLHNEIGTFDRGLRLVDRIVAPTLPPSDPEARVRRTLVGAAMRILAGRLAEGLPLARLALEEAIDLGMRTEQTEAASLIAHHAATIGDADAARAQFAAAVSTAPSALPDAIDTAVINRAADGLLLGDWGVAGTALAEGRRLAVTYGADHAPIVMAYVRTLEADLALQTGDLVAALRATEAAERPAPQLHGHHGLMTYEAWAAALAGDWRRAQAAVDQGTPLMFWCRWHRAVLGAGHALLHLGAGRLEDAQAASDGALRDIAIDEGISDPARIGLVALRVASERAVAARTGGDEALATSVVERIGPVAKWLSGLAAGDAGEGRFVRPVNTARGALGVAEWQRARAVNDPGAWHDAVARLGDVGLRYDEAYARVRLAEALLLVRGGRGEISANLAQAIEYARWAGAAPLAADIEAVARRGHLVLPEPSSNPPLSDAAATPAGTPADRWGLSSREREVLDLIAEGRTNREIGDRLFITAKTASSHVTHILDKLGVSSRVEAALLGASAEPRREA